MGNAISGEVGFPVYLEDRHRMVLDANDAGVTLDEGTFSDYSVNVLDTLNQMFVDVAGVPDYTKSPFYTAVAYDPDPNLESVEELTEAYYPILKSFNPSVTLDELKSAASNLAETAILSDEEITDSVNAFDENTKARHLRNLTRITGSFFNLRAVMTSQFGIELALAEARRAQEVNNYEQNLRVQNDGLRSTTLVNILQIGSRLHEIQHNAWARAISIQDTVARTAIDTKSAQLANDIHYDVQDVTWDLSLLEKQAALLAGLNGAPAVREPLTKFERAVAVGAQAISILAPLMAFL